MADESLPTPASSCCRKEFSYCFWAKLIVAIPAIPLIALIAASFFSTPLTQVIAGGAAAFITIILARWVDNLPVMQRKFRNSKQ